MKWYDEIAKVARELYEKSGKAEGHDLDNWLEAEKIVMTRYKEQEIIKAESSSSPKKKKVLTTQKSVNKTRIKTKKFKEEL